MKTPLEILQRYPAHDYTLWGAFQSRARTEPDRRFTLFESTTWSWRTFGEAAEKAAGLLLARGVAQGDRVGVMGTNSDGHVLLLFALARIAAINVPVTDTKL